MPRSERWKPNSNGTGILGRSREERTDFGTQRANLE
jgi:hypothetical protein